MGSTHKSLLSKLRETEMDNPLKKNPIYATLKFNEIMQDMKAEDFRAIEVQKHRKLKKDLDEHCEVAASKINTFMGLTDDEIMMNKKEFEEMGLL
jgi:hypothetical protein